MGIKNIDQKVDSKKYDKNWNIIFGKKKYFITCPTCQIIHLVESKIKPKEFECDCTPNCGIFETNNNNNNMTWMADLEKQ